MTRLARASLDNRAVVALVTLLLAVAGIVSMTSLRQELIPSLDFPTVAVVATAPGSAPEVVAEQLAAPVEQAMAGVDGLESTSSTSSAGFAVVLGELTYGTDADRARQQLQTALSDVAARLPEGASTEVVAGGLDEIPVVQLSVTSDLGEEELAARLAAEVVPALEDVEGVRDVAVSGAAEQQVRLRLDPARLAAAGLAPTAVGEALRANGAVTPVGTVTDGERTLSVTVGAPLADLDALRAVPLLPAAAGAAPVALGDVATVERVRAPATSLARTDGRPSLAVGITKAPDGNTVDVSHGVRDALPALERSLGPGTRFTVAFDQAPFIEQSIEDLTTEGLLGLVFAVVVILLFLRSLRPTLVTALSIPLSLLVTFAALRVGGYSLNILTLGALTVAVGRVVDDSIVVIENIERHLGRGEGRLEAVLGAVREVAGAVTASTLTTVAVFLPIAVVGGQVGELFRPFALTVTVALLASLLVSLTIVPVLASWFLRPPAHGADADAAVGAADEREERGRLQRAYVPLLRAGLAHPWRTLAVALALLVATGAAVPLLQTSFLGSAGQNTLTVTQELPPGTSLAAQDEAARRVEQVLADVPGVETVQTTVGAGEGAAAAFSSSAGAASFAVTTDPDADQERLLADVRARLDELSDAGDVTVAGGAGGFGSSTVDVVLTGADAAALQEASDAVVAALRGAEEVGEVSSNLAAEQPVVQVRVDRAAAARAGLTEAAVAQSLAGALRPVPLGTVVLGGVPQQVVLAPAADAPGPADLRAQVLVTAAGPVPLASVAAVEEVEVPASVTRRDGERTVTVSAAPAGDDLGAATASVTRAVDALDLPEGVEAEIGGASADQEEAFAQLGLALLAAIAVVYLVMVATFRSLLQPLLLLVSVPFAATGALGLLLVTGTPLGVAALIGMLMLVGIVVTNAIVLIDLVNQHRRAGAAPLEAVVGGARRRLRPILMTAAATVLALTPMSLGLTGGGAFISQPLAVVVIGGLVSSTLLTLVLVPVLYLLLERGRERRERRRAERGQRRGERRGRRAARAAADG